MVEIPVQDIRDTCHAALSAAGAPQQVAQLMARNIAWCEARGNRVCGLSYLESYCAQLLSGRVDGRAAPVVTQPRPGTVQVDARHGFAQVAFDASWTTVADAARVNGIAQLAIGHCHTATALGWFTEALAADGLIALAMTNASPIVAGPGGTRRIIGTNPLACAIPDGRGGLAMAFDQSTTVVTLGAVMAAAKDGCAIPEGWARDADGHPTTDPDAALKGSLASAGGAKGWGLGLMVELLASGLTGGQLGQNVKPLKAPDGPPHDLGLVVVVIDPDSEGAMTDRVEQLSRVIASDPAIRMPGQRRSLASKVNVPDALWQTCESLAG